MKGCIGYDCFGAGQQVTQSIYFGQTWQSMPEQAKEIFDVFIVVFQLYQIRYFLLESLTILPAQVLKSGIKALIEENEMVCNCEPQNIILFNMENYRSRVNVLLKQVCGLFQKSLRSENKKCPSDFLGRDFRNKDMRGLDLRDAVFLSQGQINSAKGNRNTKLPQYLEYPITWG